VAGVGRYLREAPSAIDHDGFSCTWRATKLRGSRITKPILSLRTIRRTVECEIAYTVLRMRVLERLAGNPVGIAIRPREGGAVALMARRLPLSLQQRCWPAGRARTADRSAGRLVSVQRVSRCGSRSCPATAMGPSAVSWRGSATTNRVSTRRSYASRSARYPRPPASPSNGSPRPQRSLSFLARTRWAGAC